MIDRIPDTCMLGIKDPAFIGETSPFSNTWDDPGPTEDTRKIEGRTLRFMAFDQQEEDSLVDASPWETKLPGSDVSIRDALGSRNISIWDIEDWSELGALEDDLFWAKYRPKEDTQRLEYNTARNWCRFYLWGQWILEWEDRTNYETGVEYTHASPKVWVFSKKFAASDSELIRMIRDRANLKWPIDKVRLPDRLIPARTKWVEIKTPKVPTGVPITVGSTGKVYARVNKRPMVIEQWVPGLVDLVRATESVARYKLQTARKTLGTKKMHTAEEITAIFDALLDLDVSASTIKIVNRILKDRRAQHYRDTHPV